MNAARARTSHQLAEVRILWPVADCGGYVRLVAATNTDWSRFDRTLENETRFSANDAWKVFDITTLKVAPVHKVTLLAAIRCVVSLRTTKRKHLANVPFARCSRSSKFYAENFAKCQDATQPAAVSDVIVSTLLNAFARLASCFGRGTKPARQSGTGATTPVLSKIFCRAVVII